jgi:membrane associated rhomboid family serine protease
MSEYRPGGFQILPPVIKNLIIINVLVYAAANFAGSAVHDFFYTNFSLYHWSSPLFKPWQFITHLFMHAEFDGGAGISHLFFNMFALWMFGNVIENTLGSKRFLIFYLVCGLGAAFCHLMVFTWENAESIKWFTQFSHLTKTNMIDKAIATNYGDVRLRPMLEPMVGASGAIFGVLFAFGYLFPNMMIYLYFLFPLKAKYFVAIYAIVELFFGFRNSATDNVAHFAHIGGMLFAFLLLKAWKMDSRRLRY